MDFISPNSLISQGSRWIVGQVHPHGNYISHGITLGGKSGTVNLCRLQTHWDTRRQGENNDINGRMTKRNGVLCERLSKPALGSASTEYRLFLGCSTFLVLARWCESWLGSYTSLHENASYCAFLSTFRVVSRVWASIFASCSNVCHVSLFYNFHCSSVC